MLLIIIGAVVGTRRRRAQKAREAEAAAGGTGFDGTEEVDQQYAYMNNAMLFDIRKSHAAMTPQNGDVPGPGQNGSTHAHSNETNGDAVHMDTGFEPMTADSENIYSGVVPPGSPDPKADAIIASEALVAATLVKEGKKKKERYEKNKSHNPNRDSKDSKDSKDANFELSKGGDVATRIQRLAKRLRTGISSIRWSGGDKAPENPGMDPERGPEDPAPPLQAIGPERTDPAPNARLVHVPPKLHNMPRGFAPASRMVPQQVRTTWGKTKHKQAQKELDKALKQEEAAAASAATTTNPKAGQKGGNRQSIFPPEPETS